MDQIKIGKFIASCRKEQGMTQAILAEKLGISDRAVSKWETGKSLPDSGIMLELCDLLKINVNELLSGERIMAEIYDKRAEENLLAMKREVEEKNRQMKERVEDLENKRKKLEIIRRYIQDKHGALDIIDKISSFEFIPDRVTLTRFEYQKDEAVKIEGHAKTLADINRLDAELKKTGIFESVIQDQGSNKPVRLPNRAEAVLQFQMTCTFPKRNQPTKSSAGSRATRTENMEATGDGTE